MQTSLEDALTQLTQFLDQEREALLLGLVTEAVSLHDGKSNAIQAFEIALRSEAKSDMPQSIRRRIEKMLRTAEENKQHLLAMRNGVNRLVSRINHLDESATVGAYGADGRKLAFSQASQHPTTYLKKV